MLGKTLCIGVGSMGGALLRGALQHGVLKARDTHILVRREEQCKALTEELGVVGFTTLPNVNEYNTILLAVKPQVLPSVLETLKEVPYGTVMISVAAGVTLDTLDAAIPQANWFRAMPNTPASIGAGMTALAGDDVNTDLGRAVQALFEAVGEVAVVSEADLDRLGALSGATFALDGKLEKVGKDIFMCVPVNISIDYSDNESNKAEQNEYAWENK